MPKGSARTSLGPKIAGICMLYAFYAFTFLLYGQTQLHNTFSPFLFLEPILLQKEIPQVKMFGQNCHMA